MFKDFVQTKSKSAQLLKNLIMEIKTLKLTYNQGNNVVIETVFHLILDTMMETGEDSKKQPVSDGNIQRVIKEYQQIFSEFCSS